EGRQRPHDETATDRSLRLRRRRSGEVRPGQDELAGRAAHPIGHVLTRDGELEILLASDPLEARVEAGPYGLNRRLGRRIELAERQRAGRRHVRAQREGPELGRIESPLLPQPRVGDGGLAIRNDDDSRRRRLPEGEPDPLVTRAEASRARYEAVGTRPAGDRAARLADLALVAAFGARVDVRPIPTAMRAGGARS